MSSRSYLFVFLALFALVTAFGQVEQGSITGTVTDSTGASIINVKVRAVNNATQTAAETITNESGHYRIPYLPAGTYTVTMETPGFALGRVESIPVLVGQTATVDMMLKPGTVREEVTVTSNTVQVEQQSSSLGYVTGLKQILELPISRNPYALMTLSPGVIAVGNSGTGPIVNGGRSNTSAVLLDGQDTRNNTTLDNAYTPPMEAVEEVRFITNNFSAEYGRSTGGILTAAGRGGTNDLHGSVYEYFRNDKLNANGWNNNRNRLRINPLRHNEYGLSVGGPVLLPKVYDGRNRTFFFFNWEQMKDHSPNNYTGTVPTAEQRVGDFSQTFTSAGQLIRVFDPLSTVADPNTPGQYTRTQFAGNRVPATRIDPVAAKILAYYPNPTLPGIVNNYAFPVTTENGWNKYYLRADQNFGAKNRLFFRYGIQISKTDQPFTSPAFPGEGTNAENGNSQTRGWTGVLSDTHTFTPNLVGEFRLGITRWIRRTYPRSEGFDITSLGFPKYLKDATGDAIFPRINVTDFTSLGPDRASHAVDSENTPEPQAHLTWIHGNHSIKTGLDTLFLQFNVFRPDYPSGNFSFDRTFTQGPNPASGSATAGYGLATLLLGAPTSGSFTVGPSLALLQKSYNGYVQDDWKVTRTLTLNLGVRYEYQSPWNERYNHLAYFDPSATDPITGKNGLLVPTDASDRYVSNPDKNNWAPRAGLAWTFAKDTVLRAGYGWFYSAGSGGIGSAPSDLGSGSITSTPIFLGPPQPAVNTPPPGASIANPFTNNPPLLPFPNALVGNGVSAFFRDWQTPMNQMWNANIQRNLSKNLLVEVAYVGSRGQHLWANVEANAVDPVYLSLGSQLTTLVPNPYYGKIQSGLNTPTVRYNQLLRPMSQYQGVGRLRASMGDSVYHGFTVRAERRYAQGLLFQSSFTFAKLIDNVTERFASGGSGGFINPYDLGRSRSLSDQDISQRWVSNFVYELPVGHGRRWMKDGFASWILGNWDVSGIFVLQTGTPVSIGVPCATQLPGIGCYAMRVSDPRLSTQTMDKWFNTAAFQAPPQYSMGTDSRTQPNLRNPGQINFDSVISRWQPIREKIRLQIRGEMYNIMNHPNLGNPERSLTSPIFGQITTKSGSRTIQLALRLVF